MESAKMNGASLNHALDVFINSNNSIRESIENIKSLKARREKTQIELRQYEGYVTRSGEIEASQRAQYEHYVQQVTAQLTEMAQEALDRRQGLVELLMAGIHSAAGAVTSLTEDDLTKWRIQQKHAQYKPKIAQKELKDQLDTHFEPMMESCGAQLRMIRQSISWLKEELGKGGGDDQTVQTLQHFSETIAAHIHKFIQQSCVVAHQPPVALTTVRPPKPTKHKAGGIRSVRKDTQLSCQPVIRLLGGTQLGYRSDDASFVHAYLISEDQANRLCKEPFEQVIDIQKYGENGQKATLCQNKTKFEMSGSSYVATFNPPIQMTHVYRTTGRGEELIPQQRYHLLFCVSLGGPERTAHFWKLSLPLAALVHPRQWKEQGADAYIWWEHAFSANDGMLTYVPREGCDGVPWPQFAEALSHKFTQLIEGSKTEQATHIEQIHPIALHNLASKFFGDLQDYSQCAVTFEMFFKSPQSQDSSAPPSFRVWLYQAAEVVEKFFLKEWNSGYILGFASKAQAEGLLSRCQEPTMLIKFSDTQLGCLIISYLPCFGQKVEHLRLQHKDLTSIDMNQALQVPELAKVQAIIPGGTKELLLQLTRDPGAEPESDHDNTSHPYGRTFINRVGVHHPAVQPPRQYEVISPPFLLSDEASSQDSPFSFNGGGESLDAILGEPPAKWAPTTFDYYDPNAAQALPAIPITELDDLDI